MLETLIIVNLIMVLLLLFLNQNINSLRKARYYNIKDDVRTLTFNEEELIIEAVNSIYLDEINFQKLKEELSDYPFVSQCDTEVIIAAYLKWGINCIERLQGMFAIAIFDREDNSLFLTRDRIGKKPLYYWIKDFIFGRR